MRRYEALEMGNFIKYRTYDVLCLVAALHGTCHNKNQQKHALIVFTLILHYNAPDSRLFEFTLAVNNHYDSSGWLISKNIF